MRQLQIRKSRALKVPRSRPWATLAPENASKGKCLDKGLVIVLIQCLGGAYTDHTNVEHAIVEAEGKGPAYP